MSRPTAITIAMAGLAVIGLSACATDNAATTGTTTTGATNTVAECTRAALAEPATQAARALSPDNVYTVDRVNCSDGWAVTSGLLAGAGNPDMGAPTSFVFELRGEGWVVRDKATVCGSDPISTTAPADATIPADLFVTGCAAG